MALRIATRLPRLAIVGVVLLLASATLAVGAATSRTTTTLSVEVQPFARSVTVNVNVPPAVHVGCAIVASESPPTGDQE